LTLIRSFVISLGGIRGVRLHDSKKQLPRQERVVLVFVALVLSLKSEPSNGWVKYETHEGLDRRYEVTQSQFMLNLRIVLFFEPQLVVEPFDVFFPAVVVVLECLKT